MSWHTIGKIAQLAEVQGSTIRYYEKIGLLPPPQRVNGRRIYHEDVLKRLALIRAAKSVGFTIEEILRLSTRWEAEGKPPEDWQAFVEHKLAEIEAAIIRAQHMQTLLKEFLLCGCLDDVEISLNAFAATAMIELP